MWEIDNYYFPEVQKIPHYPQIAGVACHKGLWMKQVDILTLIPHLFWSHGSN